MGSKLFSITILVLVCVGPTNAQTIIPGGSVSGIWDAAGSPYLIEADILVNASDSLIIEPGVEVIFRNFFRLSVSGVLEAEGTADDSILFTSADTATGWHGIRLFEGSGPHRMSYCTLQYSIANNYVTGDCGGAIHCVDSDLVMNHCTLRNNKAEAEGGGIFLGTGATGTIQDCRFDGNNVYGPYGYGGGLLGGYGSTTVVSNCVFMNNVSSYNGGGIATGPGSAIVVENCRFTGNTAGEDGGGFYGKASIDIIDCYFAVNSAEAAGGSTSGGAAVTVRASTSLISNCRFIDNSTEGKGGAILAMMSDLTVIDCTIRGNTAVSDGGGIASTLDTDLIVENTRFYGNSGGAGGGISCATVDTSPVIRNCTFFGNTAAAGGGLYTFVYSLTVEECKFIRNTAGVDGGGLHVFFQDGYQTSLANNLIWDNQAGEYGGGIYNYGYDMAQIRNCTIMGNTCFTDGGGICCWSSYPYTEVSNCIIWGNQRNQLYGEMYVSYSDVMGGYPGIGNIDVDPMLIDPHSLDFHLQSTTGSYHGGAWLADPNHSPCIDAGDPASPYQNEPLPNGGRVNLGVYGNTAEASLSLMIDQTTETCENLLSDSHLRVSTNTSSAGVSITYTLQRQGPVRLAVYNIAGQKVADLVNGWRDAGWHEVMFDGSNLSSGLYICQFVTENYKTARKMLLIE